jgi:nucleoside-diphosphate-sugar epimerase
VAAPDSELTVAVTGPTGTFGAGLIPLLQAEPRVERIVGVARRPFDPAERGWTKMRYRRGDVRDLDDLAAAFRGADVVVHLAFQVVGGGSAEITRAINVDGTRGAFRAAVASGVRRFVYASSVAAYGFHPDNPVGMREDWPIRPAARLFYAREKAEVERRLWDEAGEHPEVALYVLRPCIVVGPNAVGAKNLLPDRLAPLARRLVTGLRHVPLPVVVPDVPLQLVHERDVGEALCRCVLAAGPPGAYNIAADGVVTVAQLLRELGARPITVPSGPVRAAARALAAVPFLPPRAQWVEAASQPTIMDTSRAKRELGWQPRYTAEEALRDTVRAWTRTG